MSKAQDTTAKKSEPVKPPVRENQPQLETTFAGLPLLAGMETLLDRAEESPNSISQAEGAQLQRTIGNQAVGHLAKTSRQDTRQQASTSLESIVQNAKQFEQ